MIVWQGLGILVPVILGVFWLVLPGILKGLIPDAAYVDYFQYISAFCVLIGALSLWFLGRKLNGGKGRELVDEETGEKVMLKSKHTLFFIKMEYWAIPTLFLAVLIALP